MVHLKGEFTTQDLNLSATLLIKGFVLKQINKNSEGKSTFVFTNDDELNKVIQDFWNNTLLVNPQELFQALKVLKNRIYSSY